ncbi:MAG: glycosyltransferase family 2 protein [Candidatus Omnitrophota bacterium]|nr:glycosyltransferase family 2 protein [Candidatus Omnitrophota bacterium]
MKEVANTNNLVTDLVSVIVPVYNSEKYLRLCLDSIINQSYKNIEILLIDDGSTDNSGKICNEYALSDNRIKVIHTKNNGPAAARNIGIEKSKGSFIFFVDADDFIENNAINLLIENYNRYKADIIVGDFKKIKNRSDISDSGHNNFFLSSKLLTKQDIINYTRCYLKKVNRFPLFTQSWGRLFKTSIIKDNNIFFDTNLRTFEDVAFNFGYLKHTNKLFFLKAALYNHLVYDNYSSATMKMYNNNPDILFGYTQALASIHNFLKNCCSDFDIKKEIGHAYICYTIIQLVRMCGQINNSNKKKIYDFICEIIKDSDLRDNLQFYSPSKGDSRILPILMRLKLVWPIMMVCRYKAHKRYGEKEVIDESYSTLIKSKSH